MTRREFGSIRKTSAGRFQVRYTAPDGTQRKGPHTFETKRAAAAYLAEIRSELHRGGWLDPDRWMPTMDEYFEVYQSARIGRKGGAIRETTRALSADQYKRFLQPVFGARRLDSIRPSDVNRWHASLPDRPHLRRQLYSLLKATLEQARRDELLVGRNPCQIPRASQNPPSQRPSFTYRDVARVLGHLEPPFRTLAMLAFGAHLRLGEVLALRWIDLDIASGDVIVSRSVSEVANRQIETSTKTERVRVVALPEEIRAHVRDYAIAQRRDPNARVFCRPDGSTLRHFHVQAVWKVARTKADVPGLRFHDLRHVGLTMLANDGMSLRSLMYRAGHTTVSAALVYQHRAAERNEVEASALSRQMNIELGRTDIHVESFSVGPLG